LVNPPVLGVLEPWYDEPDFVRTGLAYLAGYLRQFDGFDIIIIDAKFEKLNFEQTINKIQEYNPDILGLTAFTNEIKPAAYIAAKVKESIFNCKTIIGGVHVTAIPEETMQEFPFFDIGVIGEGEETLHELCSAIREGNRDLNKIKGIIYRKEEQIIKTPPRPKIADQDSIPIPAWDLLPPAKTYYVQSERGCPLNCIFCMNPNGKIARKRSVPNVINELLFIINNFKPERISFGDELFTIDMERASQLLDAMIDAGIGKKVKWDVQTHVRYVNDELFEKFKKANVDRVELGIETGDEDALRKMGKGTNLDMIMKAVRSGKKSGVSIGTFFLFGQPNETIKSLNTTINLAVKINPSLPMFGLMTPYPGTEVAKLAAEEKAGYRLLSTNWDEYNKQLGGAMAFANLTRRQIEWLQVKAYLKVYLFNFRFKDLLFFFMEYQKAALTLITKIILKRQSLQYYFTMKPADYDLLFSNTSRITKEVLITSRNNWKKYQAEEMVPLKKSFLNQSF